MQRWCGQQRRRLPAAARGTIQPAISDSRLCIGRSERFDRANYGSRVNIELVAIIVDDYDAAIAFLQTYSDLNSLRTTVADE